MVDIEAEKKAILKALEEYVKAQNNKDLDGALKIYSEDFQFLGPDMPFIGKKELVEMVKENFKNDFTYTMDIRHLDVSESGDMAYVQAINKHVFHKPTGDVVDLGKALGVFKKEDGEWRTVSLCTNSEPSE